MLAVIEGLGMRLMKREVICYLSEFGLLPFRLQSKCWQSFSELKLVTDNIPSSSFSQLMATENKENGRGF